MRFQNNTLSITFQYDFDVLENNHMGKPTKIGPRTTICTIREVAADQLAEQGTVIAQGISYLSPGPIPDDAKIKAKRHTLEQMRVMLLALGFKKKKVSKSIDILVSTDQDNKFAARKHALIKALKDAKFTKESRAALWQEYLRKVNKAKAI